jgi:hypothetical protein
MGVSRQFIINSILAVCNSLLKMKVWKPCQIVASRIVFVAIGQNQHLKIVY